MQELQTQFGQYYCHFWPPSSVLCWMPGLATDFAESLPSYFTGRDSILSSLRVG